MGRMKHKKAIKRVQVTFTREQWELIERLRSILGSGDAEIVRNIVLAWLSEKSLISSVTKARSKEFGGVCGET